MSSLRYMMERFFRNSAAETDPELVVMMGRVTSGLTPYEPGSHIMTDDKAPVELLGMRVIDELIRDEVNYYREIWREGGLKALLELL